VFARRLRIMTVDVGQLRWWMSVQRVKKSSLGDAELRGHASRLARETSRSAPNIGKLWVGFVWHPIHTMGFAVPRWISNPPPQTIKPNGP
jgi:hypothetical protein